MPRNYGRTATSIWRDKDFRELSPEARFTYMMLFNQPNISAAGVLEVTVRKWAGNTGYLTDAVENALLELVKHDYIVIDHDSEELLIRSFVKWDGGATNDLRRKAIKDAANAVGSDLLRASIAIALDRMNVPHGLSIPPEGTIDTRRVVVKDVSRSPTPNRNPDPASATPEGEPSTLGASAAPSMFCSKHPNGTEESCGPCGTARKTYSVHVTDKLAGEIATKQARAAAIASCSFCDEHGKRLHPESRIPIGRCDHETLVTS